MRFLVVGLGSMGKRRVRNLQHLGAGEIVGFDPLPDRCRETEERYNIKTISNLDGVVLSQSDAIIISTPPDKHNPYIRLAIENKKPAFVEASVIQEGLEELNNLAKRQNAFVAPSCTMRFHPAVKDISKIVKDVTYGKITNFSYHSGQYLPDWHPWESVSNYYVSKRETGACREIVAFELSWITDITGFPDAVTCFRGKTMDIGADIDDTYVIAMNFGNSYGNVTVDVVSRYATRSLILNMEFGQILWRWDENVVKLYDVRNQRWVYYHSPMGQAAEGYNKNIAENMYVEEMNSFIEAIKGKGKFPNSLDEDIRVLKLLQKIEAR